MILKACAVARVCASFLILLNGIMFIEGTPALAIAHNSNRSNHARSASNEKLLQVKRSHRARKNLRKKRTASVFKSRIKESAAVSLRTLPANSGSNDLLLKYNKPRPKVALVLGGGGARGGAHIGVLRVLEENGLKPDLVVGNSMGAVIGALYCAGVPLDEIERLVTHGAIKKALAPVPVPVLMVRKACTPASWFKKRYPGLYSGQSLEAFINKTVGKDNQRIENLKIPFAVVCVNLLDGQAYRLTKGNLGELVRASCSLPPVLKPIEYENMLLADGAIRANLPTYTAHELGADVIVAVNVDEALNGVDKDKLRSYKGLCNRVATIVLAVRDSEHAKVADLVVHPDVSGISVLSVSDDDCRKAIEAGRSAAQEALPDLKRAFRGERPFAVAGSVEEETRLTKPGSVGGRTRLTSLHP